MRVLEFVGKAALFLAGLSAIVDLIDQAKLRRWSQHANKYAQRRSEYRKIARIVRLRTKAMDFFIKTSGFHVPMSNIAVVNYRIVHTPPQTAPSGLNKDAFITFWHTVMDELRDTYDLRDDKSLLGSQTLPFGSSVPSEVTLVERRIDEFLSRELPESEQRLISRAADAESRSVFIFTPILMMLALAAAAVVTDNVFGPGGLTTQSLAIQFLTITGVIVFIAAIVPIGMPGVLEGTLLGTAARFLEFLAEPVRPIRRIALSLFVGGSLIDIVVLFLK
ncbi:hypothetical protein ACIBQ2_29570 [Micromonospora sediminimaris]|uniref:hypothetical protein n=1 Tax=Micromonospora sediminimaris TaxID=547162 RepID=UPI003791D560